ncbi:MAG: hypothetical protein IIW26_03960, partial [Tidjanibacter sp.]|nr:hypothetical protein [Tidjanibacter sp.]
PTFMVVCFRRQHSTPRRNASQWLLGTFCHQKVQKNKRMVDANRLIYDESWQDGCRLSVVGRRAMPSGSILDKIYFVNFQFPIFFVFLRRGTIWLLANHAIGGQQRPIAMVKKC